MAEASPPPAAGLAAAPVWLCSSDELKERGKAKVWDLLEHGQAVRAFALRFDGRVRAYVNRCVHVPTEMDWLPGEFLDNDKRWIVCSIHGATYEPRDGRCVGGPCGRGRLTPLTLTECDGQVVWWPAGGQQPLAATAGGPASWPLP